MLEVELQEFNNIVSEIDALYHEAALKLGLSDSEYKMFYVIACHGEGCNQSLLYKEAGLNRSTINTAIRKMEKADALYLEQGEGRNTRVFLKDKGREYVSKVQKIIKVENQIFTSWPEQDRKIFIELNRRYAKQLESGIQMLGENNQFENE